MATPPNLISVQSNVAASLLLDGLFDEAVARLEEPLDPAVEAILANAEEPRVARLGYLARVLELERFEVARAPMPWLAHRAASENPAALAFVLAAEEPLGKPEPGGGAASWRVPGPGGHVRHFLAVRASGSGPAERKRAWLAGFFLHCCEEIA